MLLWFYCTEGEGGKLILVNLNLKRDLYLYFLNSASNDKLEMTVANCISLWEYKSPGNLWPVFYQMICIRISHILGTWQGHHLSCWGHNLRHQAFDLCDKVNLCSLGGTQARTSLFFTAAANMITLLKVILSSSIGFSWKV